MVQIKHKHGSRDRDPPPPLYRLKPLRYKEKLCSFKYDYMEIWLLFIRDNAQYNHFFVSFSWKVGGGVINEIDYISMSVLKMEKKWASTITAEFITSISNVRCWGWDFSEEIIPQKVDEAN